MKHDARCARPALPMLLHLTFRLYELLRQFCDFLLTIPKQFGQRVFIHFVSGQQGYPRHVRVSAEISHVSECGKDFGELISVLRLERRYSACEGKTHPLTRFVVFLNADFIEGSFKARAKTVRCCVQVSPE